MATSSFQKNFSVKSKQANHVVSVMTSDSLGANMSKNFDSKFSGVSAFKGQLSSIFSTKKDLNA